MHVWVLAIENEYDGMDITTYTNRGAAEKALFEYVAENWDAEDAGPIPENDSEAVDDYFRCSSEETYYLNFSIVRGE